MKKPQEKRRDLALGTALVMAGIAAVLALALGGMITNAAEVPARMWIGGGGALGLVTGFATGAAGPAEANGSGTKLISFIGTGLVVPLAGAVTAFVGSSESTTVNSVYQNGHVVQETTEAVTTYPSSLLHPIAVFGAFFVAFGILAVFGIIAGSLLRKWEVVNVLMAT